MLLLCCNFPIHSEFCTTFDLSLTTECGDSKLPWFIECLKESDPQYEICTLLHNHQKNINKMSLNFEFSTPKMDLYIGSKKIEIDQKHAEGNSIDIKVHSQPKKVSYKPISLHS